MEGIRREMNSYLGKCGLGAVLSVLSEYWVKICKIQQKGKDDGKGEKIREKGVKIGL